MGIGVQNRDDTVCDVIICNCNSLCSDIKVFSNFTLVFMVLI